MLINSHKKQVNDQLEFYNYNFEKVFKEETTSENIYKLSIREDIIKSLQNCIDTTILAYGQTCSGKTYTILGV